MKARIKGTTEWKDYKEVFGEYGVFQGLETAGYKISALDNYLRLGGTLNPDDEFQKARLASLPDEYVSTVLPLECFDLWEEPKEFDWSAFRREAAKDILCAFAFNLDESPDVYVPEFYSQVAIEWADKLIKQLKEETK